jgi:hypothetical protein
MQCIERALLYNYRDSVRVKGGLYFCIMPLQRRVTGKSVRKGA